MSEKQRHVLHECFELRSPVTLPFTARFRRSHRLVGFYFFKQTLETAWQDEPSLCPAPRSPVSWTGRFKRRGCPRGKGNRTKILLAGEQTFLLREQLTTTDWRRLWTRTMGSERSVLRTPGHNSVPTLSKKMDTARG